MQSALNNSKMMSACSKSLTIQFSNISRVVIINQGEEGNGWGETMEKTRVTLYKKINEKGCQQLNSMNEIEKVFLWDLKFCEKWMSQRNTQKWFRAKNHGLTPYFHVSNIHNEPLENITQGKSFLNNKNIWGEQKLFTNSTEAAREGDTLVT